MFILHLVKNSQILVNEDICLPIVGEISQSTIFPWSATFFYYYLISWLALNWNSLGPLINCYDYFNNNQDYIFFNFYCLKLQHMSKISIITLMPKHSFHIYLHFHSDFFTNKLTLKKTETIKTFSLQSFDQVK